MINSLSPELEQELHTSSIGERRAEKGIECLHKEELCYVPLLDVIKEVGARQSQLMAHLEGRGQ